MLKAIQNNPYRILGVYSNSPKKEQIANKGKMQAFLRVKKSMPFDLDLKGLLPDIQRTQELVDIADSELALSSGQIKNAQFWFMNKTPIDGVAFNHLNKGNIDSAIEFWKKSVNLSSLQNLFISYLIKGDYKSAILNYAIPLYSQYSKEFVTTIDEKSNISSDSLIQTVVETLSNEGVDLLPLTNGITDNTWKSLIEAKKVDPLLSKLNTHVSEAKATKSKGASARLTAGNKLKIATKPLLQTLQNIIGKSDTRYQMIADKVAQEVLQCSIDYYNDSEDLDKPSKAIPLCEYAKSVAVGNAAKQRCEQNYDVIKEAFDNMPPVEVANEAKLINDLLTWYSKQSETSENALSLLRKARDILIVIKEKLGKRHNYYLETSSLIGSAALSNVIYEVNESQKEDRPNPLGGLFGSSSPYSFLGVMGEQERRRQKAHKLKGVLRDAWQTILFIDRLDKTEDFNKNRYQKNRKALYSLINGCNGFDYPDGNYILKGCAHGLTADLKYFWSDSEYYDSATSKSDYKAYLRKFPNGNHTEEAKQKIAEIEERDKRVTKYIIIAVAIAIALFIIIIAANGNSGSSRPQISRPNISRPTISRPTINVSRPEVDRFYNNSYYEDDEGEELDDDEEIDYNDNQYDGNDDGFDNDYNNDFDSDDF